MSNTGRGPVVVDTSVFSARLGRREGYLAAAYRSVLTGRPAIISFITVAELRYGAMVAGWGAKRRQRLANELARAVVVWAGPELTEKYAELRSWCVGNGHALHQKDHEADRWIAATALRLDVPLVAHDAIFANVENLRLITQLPVDGT